MALVLCFAQGALDQVAFAQTATLEREATVQNLLQRLETQAAALQRQAEELERQQSVLAAQRAEIERFIKGEAISPDVAEELRGAGMQAPGGAFRFDPSAAPAPAPVPTPRAQPAASPQGPVGEAPPEPPPPIVEALPEGVSILTRPGATLLDATLDYSRSSTNRLVFRGVELAPGLPLGAFEASDVDRDTTTFTLSAKRGLTSRIDAELRVPYLWRSDRVELVAQRDETIARIREVNDSGVGDVELILRYQLNRQIRRNVPFAIAALRIKSDTGLGSFEVERDAAGVATELPTGSGFWGVEPGINFILPSEEGAIVVYGGASYLFHLARDVNERQGSALIGRVDPGDSVGLNLGYGFAVNSQFSSSVGYRHNVVLETDTEINGVTLNSDTLQVGAVTLGMSYRFGKRVVSASVDIGVTEDSPDVRLSLRLPLLGR